jgi:hypothetical protein
MTPASLHTDRGQAVVELLAFLPLVLIAGLAAASILAEQGAQERAGQAAHAGAMALLQDGDARAAARAALEPGDRRNATVTLAGRRVSVTIPSPRPLRLLVPRLEAHATADAGPEAAP